MALAVIHDIATDASASCVLILDMSALFPDRYSAAATASPAKIARANAKLSCPSMTTDATKGIVMLPDIINAIKLRNLKTARNLKKSATAFHGDDTIK
jgi:hypothetical protein